MSDPATSSMSSPLPGPGGFFQSNTGLLSPTPSQASSSSRTPAAGLPHPRSRALRPGSAKENLVRRYMDQRILHISRRFVKKFGVAQPDDTVIGYKSMGELCRDVDAVLNNLWKSGTPSLQVQYLLRLASELITWMDGFPPSPRATLAVLRKLDYCFASLLAGEDWETKEPLPGFEHKGLRAAGLSRTDMVRCRSIAEQTRVAVVDVFRRGPPDPADERDRYYRSERRRQQQQQQHNYQGSPTAEPPQVSAVREDEKKEDEQLNGGMTEDDDGGLRQREETEGGEEDEVQEEEEEEYEDDDDDDDDDDNDGINEDLQMGVARVYELTLVKLGEALGGGYGGIGDGLKDSAMTLDDENDDEY